jgi:hypothetical protein
MNYYESGGHSAGLNASSKDSSNLVVNDTRVQALEAVCQKESQNLDGELNRKKKVENDRIKHSQSIKQSVSLAAKKVMLPNNCIIQVRALFHLVPVLR